MFFRDDEDTPKIRMNGRQKLFILAVDLVILIELCIAMAVSNGNPDTFTPTFMKTFFSMFGPTLVAAFLGHRALRNAAHAAQNEQSNS